MTLIRNIIHGGILAASMTLGLAYAQEARPAALVSLGNGEIITEKDVNQYIGRRIDLKPMARNVSGIIAIVQDMALTRALVMEGRVLGLSQGGERSDNRFDDVYAYAVFKYVAPVCEAPKDRAAAREFYDKNPKAFEVPTTVRLSRVILPTSASLDGEHAGMWMMNQVQAIGAGSQKFEDVASKASRVYKLEVQGDLGWVPLNADNQILRALGNANQNDIVGPVKDGDFIYLFHIVDKRPGKIAPWDDVSSVASQRALSYCREQGRANVQQQMFQKYGVRVDENAIRRTFEVK